MHASFLTPALWKNWHDCLDIVSRRLHEQGYWGPVGIDAFLFAQTSESSNAKLSFRPISDINARHTMADVAWGLQKRFPDRKLAWLWVRNQELPNPNMDTWDQWESCWGDQAYHAQSRRGLLPLCPFEISHGQKSLRQSIAVIGLDDVDIARLLGLFGIESVLEVGHAHSSS